MITDAELLRSKRGRARRKASKTVVFQKIHRGLYMSHEWGMTLSHEAVWHKDTGRKWNRGLILAPQSTHVGSADAMPLV